MTDLEKQIQEYVEKGLSGDMASVNSIDDRILRGKVKAAIVKAKRLGVKKGSSQSKKTDAKPSSDDIITKLVDEGLTGNMENINALDDRVLRAKVKSALIKAKKQTVKKIDKTDSNPLKSGINKGNPNVKFAELIQQKFPDSLQCEINEDYIGIKPDHWLNVAQWLKSDSEACFDSLQCVTGTDIGESKLDSRYNLHSMELGHLIEVRIEVSIENPKIPSIEQIWRSGDWFERETYDMYGIKYEGHRDLRRMLLPEDWEGFPLRKDYQEQETYHGIIVKKIKEEVWD